METRCRASPISALLQHCTFPALELVALGIAAQRRWVGRLGYHCFVQRERQDACLEVASHRDLGGKDQPLGDVRRKRRVDRSLVRSGGSIQRHHGLLDTLLSVGDKTLQWVYTVRAVEAARSTGLAASWSNSADALSSGVLYKVGPMTDAELEAGFQVAHCLHPHEEVAEDSTKSSIKRWIDDMGVWTCSHDSGDVAATACPRPATECHIDGYDPLGTDHGVMVVKDEHDRILITHEAASENGEDARQYGPNIEKLSWSASEGDFTVRAYFRRS